jgi:hypothetical protein
MRLAILDSGHGFGTKALFAFIRAVLRHPVPEVVKLVKYRPDFFGTPYRAARNQLLQREVPPSKRMSWIYGTNSDTQVT